MLMIYGLSSFLYDILDYSIVERVIFQTIMMHLEWGFSYDSES